MPQIKESLERFNTWWKQGFKLEFRDRDIYKQIGKFLNLPQIIALTGLRRVGKTTIMLKIVKDKIKAGLNPQNVLFFSFDEFRGAEIMEIVKIYEKVLEKDIKKEKYLFLFDEIQKLRNWEDQLKTVYDLFKNNVKIIISGSESLFIRKKSKESLAGRIFEFKVDTLSFSEFLNFREVKVKPIGIHERELEKLFEDYILSLGFPELFNIKDREIIEKYIEESVIDKVIFKDIPTLYKIEDISILKSILDILIENPGQLIELSEFARELKISRQTLSKYLKYLEDSFLIKKLYNFSKNRRKIERKLKKYYPTIISPVLLFKEDNYSKSRVFEWIIVNSLKAEFFWRNPYKDEVDVVLYKDKRIIPIEIKYGRIETGGIEKFMKEFNIRQGYIISLGKEDMLKRDKKSIAIIPAYKFFLKHK